MKRLALAALLICLWAVPAKADDKFTHMDANNDDAVTWEEFSTQYPQMKKGAFEAIDTDSNGAISHDEWHAFMGSHGAGGQGMGGGMGGGMSMPPKGMTGMPPGHPDTGTSGKMLIEPPKTAE